MKKEYLPKVIEPYVQKKWKKRKTFQVTEDKEKKKYFCLSMLPYPSGKLHMGHVRNYTISDIIARYNRMLGKNVLHPIGWDAFGLPAEEAAIKNKINPKKWTIKNILYMKKQLKSLGFSYDWNREITTCNSSYYKWEQWFFSKLYKKKLIYKKNSLVNWCPNDKTVLANEQVIQEKCWRCQTPVILKKKPQWFLQITKYAKELLKDIKKLKKWPKEVKKMQENWIGKLKGFEIELCLYKKKKKIFIFTTQLELIKKLNCIKISPLHKLAKKLIKKNKKIKKIVKKYKNNLFLKSKKKHKKLKGIHTNLYALNPFKKSTKIPIWIDPNYPYNQKLKNYGLLSTPKYNLQDLKFSIKNKIKINLKEKKKNLNQFFIKETFIKKLNRSTCKKKSKKNFLYLLKQKIIKKKIIYNLQDWCISRQRKWGTPIPIATIKKKKLISLPKEILPIKTNYNFKNDNQSKILKSKINYISKKFSIRPKDILLEKDTFDTFVQSSWYYARYTCPKFKKGMLDKKKTKYWLPIDCYIGGIEHAIMHLMYFRFYHKLMRDFGLVFSNEPAKKLICQGMVLSDAYYFFNKKKKKIWINSAKIKRKGKKEFFFYLKKKKQKVKHAGKIKMSKSKNNGIEPKEMVKKYGADSLRMFMISAAPIESDLEWNEAGIKGMNRFLKKLWNFSYICLKRKKKEKKNQEMPILNKKILRKLNETILIVSTIIKKMKSLNTIIPKIIKFINYLIKIRKKEKINFCVIKKILKQTTLILYPFAPHFCFILWKNLNQSKENIDFYKWPIADTSLIKTKKTIIIVQINGKTREKIKISRNLDKKKIFSIILNNQKIKKYINGKKINKIIYIPNKVINFVLKTINVSSKKKKS